jgi:protease-4
MWRALRRRTARTWLATTQSVRRLGGRLPAYGVLQLTISGDLPESEPEPRLFGLLRRGAEDYCGLLSALRWARTDPRLAGVLVYVGPLRVGWARAEGIRRAMLALRAAGKRVWVHLASAGVREYLIASAADRVVLAPAGTLDISGLSSEVTFLFGALEKLGVQAEVVQLGRYKAMGETLTRRDMSPSHREMVAALIDDLYGHLIDGIAAGRGLEPTTCRALMDRGPFLAREALAEHLIDAIEYADESEAQLQQACGDAQVIELRDYVARRGREVRAEMLRRERGAVALVSLVGTVKSGDSVAGPDGAAAVGAASVARDLKKLRARDDIRAVVLRIASPGGSGLASDLIWREIVRTREQKPVVVSFGDVAASGGYYAGVAARPIFAEPGTLTGSIGVVAGKANVRGLLDRLGVTKEVVSRGRHAALYSSYVPLNDADRARLQAQAESFYDDFIAKVAAGRALDERAIHQVAEGRVWTGRQAWARGLIDHLGGLEEAIDHAKQLIGVPAGEPVVVERFPRPRRLWRLPIALGRSEAHLADWWPRLTWLHALAGERIWALMPFRFRFF